MWVWNSLTLAKLTTSEQMSVCIVCGYEGRRRKWRYWELIKEHMGRINTNDTNWVETPVTKLCLNWMAGQFSSRIEMSSNRVPSGNTATNNYRKLTLYLNSQMKGTSSRHLSSQMNTEIFRWMIWNNIEANCVFQGTISTCAKVLYGNRKQEGWHMCIG